MPDVSLVLEGRYRLDSLLGRGGMADVYRAHDLRLGRDVAVKMLREVEHEQRFAVETRTLALLDHPNLVRLLDAGNDGDSLYLVMELLSGASVFEVLRDGPVAPDRVADIGRETAAALAFIHARNIVHRDVKPSNLMFDEHGTLRLADFGIVRLLDGVALTATHQTIGTMAYLAPEQLRGDEIGPAADIYALGLVLLECLTGRRAFEGAPSEAGAARLARDPEMPSGLPQPWPALLPAMTARDPSARPTAEQVRASLDVPAPAEGLAATAILDTPAAALATAPVPIAHPPAAPTPDATRRRSHARAFTLGAIGVLIALAVGLAAWAATRGGSPTHPAITTTTRVASVASTTVTSPPTTATTTPATTRPPATTVAPRTTTPATTAPRRPVIVKPEKPTPPDLPAHGKHGKGTGAGGNGKNG